ncbi:hypothetical protein LCGC14_1488280 [marine sediment metagenome]|uniref:Helix-turn-helix domain-containing protein n=1 Tax=marine sediment metagenome TaxID=412755 RepID=A0A0F9J7H1_9ZZZZ
MTRMVGDPGQDEVLWGVRRLHDALVEHSRVFLSNAVARVYRRAAEPPPMPVGKGHPAEGRREYWVPFTDTLERRNDGIQEAQERVEEWQKQGRLPLPADLERAGRPLWTPESFAAHLISAFGQDGNPLDRAKACFESLHEEDLGRETVTAHWLITDRTDAEELERSAVRGDQALRQVMAWLPGTDPPVSVVEFEATVRGGLRCRGNRWRPREVAWRYIGDLVQGIGETRKLRQWALGTVLSESTDDAARPDDLITLRVAVQKFLVSRATLQRAIKSGQLRSYRLPDAADNRQHIVSGAEVARLYEPKP